MPRGYFLRADGLLILGVFALVIAGIAFSYLYLTYFSFVGRSLAGAVFSIALFVAVWAVAYGLLIVFGAMHDIRTAKTMRAAKLPELQVPAGPAPRTRRTRGRARQSRARTRAARARAARKKPRARRQPRRKSR